MKNSRLCLNNDPECCELFVSEVSKPQMKCKAGNDNRRVRHTMLYFKRVAIFRNKNYPNSFYFVVLI